MRRLDTVPGVGPVTAATFVATLDTVARFAGPHPVAAYLGLIPSEWSSGERQQRGAITKVGHRRARRVLVQAAWSLLRTRSPDAAALRAWAQQLDRAPRQADRRGCPRPADRRHPLRPLARWHGLRAHAPARTPARI